MAANDLGMTKMIPIGLDFRPSFVEWNRYRGNSD